VLSKLPLLLDKGRDVRKVEVLTELGTATHRALHVGRKCDGLPWRGSRQLHVLLVEWLPRVAGCHGDRQAARRNATVNTSVSTMLSGALHQTQL
jgi:hypothetical protein